MFECFVGDCFLLIGRRGRMKRTGLSLFLILLFLLLAFSTQAVPAFAAEDGLSGPWDGSAHRSITPDRQASQKSTSVTTGFFTSLLTFFSEVISPVDGDRCPSYPTCAAYSKQAYEKHGALVGTLMTVDRMIHEASESDFSPIVRVYGVNRIYDPVSANEFWKRDRNPQNQASE
jgi:hypothetical protein